MSDTRYCKDCAYYRNRALRRNIFGFRPTLIDPICEHEEFKSLVDGISDMTCAQARQSTVSYCNSSGKHWEPKDPKERTIFLLKKTNTK